MVLQKFCCLCIGVNSCITQFCFAENVYNITSLNDYEPRTNQNFRIEVAGVPYYLRVGRKKPEELGIDRKTEIHHYKIAEQLGLAPALLGYHLDNGMLITEFIEGASEAKIHDHEILTALIDRLKKLHRYEYKPLPRDIQTVFSKNDNLLQTFKDMATPAGRESNIREWLKVKERVKEGHYNGIPLGLCHADLFRGNILESDEGGLYIIDWEYSYYGYIIDDLGKLCSSNHLSKDEIQEVVNLYWGNEDYSLFKRLKENVFMHQLNFYLWCHIQAQTNNYGNVTTYLELAEYAEKDLNHLVNEL